MTAGQPSPCAKARMSGWDTWKRRCAQTNADFAAPPRSATWSNPDSRSSRFGHTYVPPRFPVMSFCRLFGRTSNIVCFVSCYLAVLHVCALGFQCLLRDCSQAHVVTCGGDHCESQFGKLCACVGHIDMSKVCCVCVV